MADLLDSATEEQQAATMRAENAEGQAASLQKQLLALQVCFAFVITAEISLCT